MSNGTRFTTYGIKTTNIIGFNYPRPVGMNCLLHVSGSAPTPREIRSMVAVAEARRMNFLIVFDGEKAIRIRVIGTPMFSKQFEIDKESL